jgi:hypothetical protein
MDMTQCQARIGMGLVLLLFAGYWVREEEVLLPLLFAGLALYVAWPCLTTKRVGL